MFFALLLPVPMPPHAAHHEHTIKNNDRRARIR
jgi:hypothetical protein